MPIYLYWGEDEFAIAKAVAALRQKTLDPDWSSFNLDKLGPDQPDAVLQALNQAMTPPFGAGQRLVWLVETTICQRCTEETLAELDRSLPAIPGTTVLLLTTPSKPDGRLKSTKLLQKYAEIREFPVIPPWKPELLAQQVTRAAQSVGVRLTPRATELLAEAVGNDTRQLYTELEKLSLYGGTANLRSQSQAGQSQSQAGQIDEAAITALVTASSQNAVQLANAIRQAQVAPALDLVADLLRQNQPALRIVSTLVTYFRRWLWVKLLVESGERNEQTIAQAADIGNPKQLYYVKKDIEHLSLPALLKTLPLLLELEFSLKDGADERAVLQTKIIELCELCR